MTYPTLDSLKLLCVSTFMIGFCALSAENQPDERPFGEGWETLDHAATGTWWEREFDKGEAWLNHVKVPREEVVAFGLYTVSNGVLKLSAQLYPLMPDEDRVVRLEVKRESMWVEIARAPVYDLGWSAHFRITDWDDTQSVPYRLRHGERAMFEGFIREDPQWKDEIVLAGFSCNSNTDRGDRAQIIRNVLQQDPDILFFAGDQSYDHRQHTAAWLMWGEQFKEIIRDRPVVTIPDDHDVGQGNLWGEGGILADSPAGDSGGYYYPAKYVNMVQRCQTWHLPDPYDASPIERGISVYYTSLNVGGVDFAIIEDRKFKSGPKGKIPQMGPRPDHINDPAYDRSTIDLPGLKLLGDRQLHFLNQWARDWTDTEMKAVLSQTNFCGAVHLHGPKGHRLLADLDSNAWPQTGRNNALRAIRRAGAVHIAGDQHLSVLVQHGIESYRDGPYSFVVPATVNEYYGRWWWPLPEELGNNPVRGSQLPWTGDFEDGLGNKITMLAYANPDPPEMFDERFNAETYLADGYSIIRFNKRDRSIIFENWPRQADLSEGDTAQFTGWPVAINLEANDGRQPKAYLPVVQVRGLANPVIEVIREDTGESLYTRRFEGNQISLPVFTPGTTYSIGIGQNRPEDHVLYNVRPVTPGDQAKPLVIEL